jgi:mannose-6-phosphate isomerase
MKEIITDDRPWGSWERFTHNEMSTVKILHFKPKGRVSLQSHTKRDELWFALDDGVVTELDGVTRILKKGETIFIPRGTKHRVGAGDTPVRILEIAYGEQDEDDIIRYEDDYGRVVSDQ